MERISISSGNPPGKTEHPFLKYRMTPEEVLTAVTLNAAAAIGRAGTIGSVEPGKQADLLLWNAPDLDYVCYRFGSNLVGTVMKKGRIVHEE